MMMNILHHTGQGVVIVLDPPVEVDVVVEVETVIVIILKT